jgi:hypothetical protein
MATAKALAKAGIVSPDYWQQIDALPASMRDLYGVPTLELELVYSWSLEEARRLDDHADRFAQAVAEKLTEVLTTLGDH